MTSQSPSTRSHHLGVDLETQDIPLLNQTARQEQAVENSAVHDVFQGAKWPGQPRTLTKSPLEAFLNRILVFLALAITFPYIILAVGIARYNQQPVSDISHDDLLYLYITLAATPLHVVFPYAFSFTAGQTIKTLATWKLQRGVSLSNLEQMMGSTTVSGAITVHLLLRPLNIWVLVLGVLWASSPLGNYLLSRLSQVTPSAMNSTVAVQYLDTAQASIFYSKDFSPEIESGPIADLYNSGLFASQSSRTSSMDPWGNIKIPYYSRLDSNITADANGWKYPPESGLLYSALLGVPISALPTSGNTTFTITTTYLDLDCYNISQGPPIYGTTNDGNTWTYITNGSSFFLSINGYTTPVTSLSSSISDFTNATNGTTIPHTLLF